jgi:hypothetical protein
LEKTGGHFSISGIKHIETYIILIHETMKDKRKTRKLEFKKETIARLGEWQMNGVLGGTGSPNNSHNNYNPCTHGIRTRVAKATCVNLLCKTQ